jgi:hypothetical protein
VGNCNNGHSDSLELVSVKQSVFEGNFLHHAKQTSTLFFSNYPDPSKTDWFNEDILFINNIFYSPETGLAAYICKAHNIRLYHNVIWGKRKNKYGGLGIAPYVTDLHMYNNIILSVNLSHMGAVFDPKEHHADNNLVGVDLGQFPLGPHDVVASDPKFDGVGDVDADDVPNPTVNDFLPVPGSPAINAGWAGDATHVMPQTDMLGNGRQGVPDLGALESSW